MTADALCEYSNDLICVSRLAVRKLFQQIYELDIYSIGRDIETYPRVAATSYCITVPLCKKKKMKKCAKIGTNHEFCIVVIVT